MKERTLQEQFNSYLKDYFKAHSDFIAASDALRAFDAVVDGDKFDAAYLKVREADTRLDVVQSAFCSFISKNSNCIRFE